MLGFLDDPSTITHKKFQDVQHKLCQPLRSSDLVKEDEYIIICEHVNDDTYVNSNPVPSDLQREIFLAFHSNPLGSHY